MLALRLARRGQPLVQLRRLLVAAASAGTGFLLLCTLGYALAHPEASATSALRLAWCVVPLAATVYFAAAVARTDPATRPRAGLTAVGLGPGGLLALSVMTTALSTVLGSLTALLAFFHLRGNLTALPLNGTAAGFLAADRPLPLPATLTLLALTPITASAATALTLHARYGEPRRGSRPATEPAPDPEPSTPSGLPWGAALLAAGLAVEAYGSRSGRTPTLSGGTAGALAGWALTAIGLAMAGPAITYACGRLLQAARPGALRLLAGRVLQTEARRIGRPLGVVCAVASGTYAMAALYAGTRPTFGPLTTIGVLVVAGCAVLTLLTAAVEARQERADTTAALLRLGAPASALRNAAALRTAALLTVFTPLTWLVAALAALPLTT
ncbi:hypothetical protein ACFV6E_19540 [Streptomyces sp. NPDC059785]|uniref:hypothetical protein n=1 Tax=Streptomyces sp. NPDC059785 TaxID=3346945 RepID=UPI00364B7535